MSENPASLSMNELLLNVHGAAVIQLLRSGVELNAFEVLYEHRHLTLHELNAHIQIDEQSIRTLFIGLTSLTLVHKEGESYANSRVIEELIEAGDWKRSISLPPDGFWMSGEEAAATRSRWRPRIPRWK